MKNRKFANAILLTVEEFNKLKEYDKLKEDNIKLKQHLEECVNSYKIELHIAEYDLRIQKENVQRLEKRICELQSQIDSPLCEICIYRKRYLK